jgi:hypothetical protein
MNLNHVLKKIGRGRDLNWFIGLVFRNLHALGYPKPKTILTFIDFWVNSSLSMMCRQSLFLALAASFLRLPFCVCTLCGVNNVVDICIWCPNYITNSGVESLYGKSYSYHVPQSAQRTWSAFTQTFQCYSIKGHGGWPPFKTKAWFNGLTEH